MARNRLAFGKVAFGEVLLASTLVMSLTVSAGGGPGQNMTAGRGALFCLPTCSSIDGRFLALSTGSRFASLGDPVQNFQIVVPPGGASFEIGVFDGDCGGVDGVGDHHWDKGAAPFELTVFVDPDQDGASTLAVLGPTASSGMANNGWTSFAVPKVSEAQNAAGNLVYRLEIRALDPSLRVINAFKVRSEGRLGIRVDQQPFGIFPSITDFPDGLIIFPDYPDLSTTTYDGVFDLPFYIPQEVEKLVIWDGDFDFGSFDGADQDTDDATTPGSPFLPDWATPVTVPEGAAVGRPADDSESVGIVRSPSVRYAVLHPGGRISTNDDASGNLEWENFVISTEAFDPRLMDVAVPGPALEAGIYRLRAEGVDMQNMNFLRLPGELLCVNAAGQPCQPVRLER